MTTMSEALSIVKDNTSDTIPSVVFAKRIIAMKVVTDELFSNFASIQNLQAGNVVIGGYKKTESGEVQNFITESDVDHTISSKGYQTEEDVENTISEKGFQTESDVESTISSKGFATNTKVDEITDNIYSKGTTTIDGGKITTGSIKSEQIDVEDLFATNIEADNMHLTGDSTVEGSVFAKGFNCVLENGNSFYFYSSPIFYEDWFIPAKTSYQQGKRTRTIKIFGDGKINVNFHFSSDVSRKTIYAPLGQEIKIYIMKKFPILGYEYKEDIFNVSAEAMSGHESDLNFSFNLVKSKTVTVSNGEIIYIESAIFGMIQELLNQSISISIKMILILKLHLE